MPAIARACSTRASERAERALRIAELQPEHADRVERVGIARQVREQRLERSPDARAIARLERFERAREEPPSDVPTCPAAARRSRRFFSPIGHCAPGQRRSNGWAP